MAVRTRAGLFDVSHMGEIEIAGADALAAVQRITSNDASKLASARFNTRRSRRRQGTFVDDVLTYKLADEHFMLVVNASNIIKDSTGSPGTSAALGDAVAVNTSSRYALLALQGPAARDVLQTLTGVDSAAMKYYWFTTGEVASVRCTISRTGYTGEDGFEVFVPAGFGRARMGRNPVGRARRGRRSCRAGRTGHASARSGDASLRQRHGRHDHRRSKPISGGLSAGRRRDSSASTFCSGRKRTGVPREAGWIRDARSRRSRARDTTSISKASEMAS